ncbi:hypothetical protein JCM1840_003594 [Sporobolomyces johnsonii]
MSWQEQIRLSLIARDQREQAHAPMIEHYRRLAAQTVAFKERNQALVAASAGAARSANAPGGAPGAADPVRQALITSLETELAKARTDLSEQYKLQSLNAQRLLNLTDSLREAEERGREEREELRSLRHEVEGLREAARRHSEIVEDKKRQLLILQDEHDSHLLELTQQDILVAKLREDNKNLLDRWLEAKREEAERMNEANAFMEEVQRLKKDAAERDGKGKGKEKE